VLREHCYGCHGPSKTGGVDYVLNARVLKEKKKLVPGEPGKSKIISLIRKGTMPPDTEKKRPGAAEVAVLEKWIAAGAPDFPDERRTVVPKGILDTLGVIHKHLRDQEPEDRRYFRYFTLTHLYNNPEVTETDLRLYRAALSKVVNSLSWKRSIHVPRALDREGTVLVIDLRRLDWDRRHAWDVILKHYPYGLAFDDAKARQVRNLARDIYRDLKGTKVPFVRADWFVANAARPPLYHSLLYDTLLRLKHSRKRPMTAGDLEKKLGIDVLDNIKDDRVWRAGFTGSGVSSHNRMVERHETTLGAYWKSYDFKSSVDVRNLTLKPLGPVFTGNKFEDHAFEHDGGEIIFNLPNGLQGYLLVNEKDQRIDEGPTKVVEDKLKTGGTPEVINGISCMACHKHGMIADFKDGIRDHTDLEGDVLRKLRRQYSTHDDMKDVLEEDTDRFMGALKRATARFLLVGADRDRKLEDFEEPVVRVSTRHVLREVTLELAAFELGLEDAQVLRQAIRNNPRLGRLGLKPLAGGKSIKRETWESVFQDAASELDLGVPARKY
jgi:serine/threonine-protein kinase